jgi:hypothetical protein
MNHRSLLRLRPDVDSLWQGDEQTAAEMSQHIHYSTWYFRRQQHVALHTTMPSILYTAAASLPNKLLAAATEQHQTAYISLSSPSVAEITPRPGNQKQPRHHPSAHAACSVEPATQQHTVAASTTPGQSSNIALAAHTLWVCWAAILLQHTLWVCWAAILLQHTLWVCWAAMLRHLA